MSVAVTPRPDGIRAASRAASRNGTGGPKGSTSTKSKDDPSRRSRRSREVASASTPLRATFARRSARAIGEASLRTSPRARASRAIRIPHAPVAASPSRTRSRGPGHRARTTALTSRLTAIVGL
ncbi:MAG: hypothetical protein A3K59_08820 [Euryarchaeota archaeon RBG_19FT_COMBO_69_17]|nr:MAG: hypothetical protein A3K59_08820 [Euryarchaeota archaeon RBG_19FT_COMBO_69_17]